MPEPQMSLDAKKAIVRDFLSAHSTLVLSTVGEQGIAHSSPLFYLLAQDLQLYWFSSASSAHSRSIQVSAQAGVSVHNTTFDWREIVGVQMRGEATVAPVEEREPVLSRYTQRFNLGRSVSARIVASTLYVFRPVWIRYIDNSKGLGYGFEFEVR